MRVQAQFELSPKAAAKTTSDGTSMTTDLAVAYGVTAMFDYAVTPYLSIGVAPRLVLNLVPDPPNGDTPNKEIDLRASIRGHVAVTRGLEVQASLYPGYAIVLSSQLGTDDPKGFAIGGAVGASYDVSPQLFIAAEIGYQRAFTSATVQLFGPPISADLELENLHLAIGAGARF